MFRLTSVHDRLVSGALGLGLTSAVMMFGFGVSSSAVATPADEVAVFAQCPLDTPGGVDGCLVLRGEGGEITIGKLRVPIVNTQVMQGGFINSEETGAMSLVGAANGETFPRTPQRVPDGTVQCDNTRGSKWFGRRGHRRWFERGERGLCRAIFENKHAGLYITPELAAPVSSIILDENAAFSEQGTAISLPVKFKLENPLLGDDCYIGSDTNPIVIELTDGTSGSLTGKIGQITTRDEARILIITASTFVDNTFAAPAATDCGYGGRLDSFINTKLGLPAPAGTNAEILIGTHEQAGARLVRESEESSTTPSSTPPPPHGEPGATSQPSPTEPSISIRG